MAKRQYQRKKTKKKNSTVFVKLFRGILLLLILAAVLAYLSFRGWNSKMMNAQNAFSSIVNTSMGPIEYTIKGEGSIILLSHMEGSGSDNIELFDPLTKAGFKIICPSRPGYLNTPLNEDANYAYQADLFAELLDHLNINEKITVMGISAGGPAAIEFAKKYSDQCSSLILINSPGSKLESSEQMQRQFNLKTIPYLSEFSDINSWLTFYLAKYNTRQILTSLINNSLQSSDDAKKDKIDLLMSHSETKEELLNFLRQTSPKSNRETGINNDLKNLNTYNIGSKKVRVRSLIVHSKINNVIAYKHAEQIKKIFPNSQLYTYEGLGHAFWLGDDFNPIESKILEFLSNHIKRKVELAPLTDEEIIGITWVNKTDGALLQLKPNGSFSLDFPSVDTKKYYQGVYAIVDNQISFTYDVNIESCSKNPGVYKFKVSKNVLDLKVLNDDCNNRKSQFTEGWFKI